MILTFLKVIQGFPNSVKEKGAIPPHSEEDGKFCWGSILSGCGNLRSDFWLPKAKKNIM